MYDSNLQNQKNRKINLLKGIACIAIIFIHVPFPGVFGRLVAIGADCAVPIFFMISGFFAFNKKEQIIKRRLKKITIIFIVSYFIYLLLYLLMSIKDKVILDFLIAQFNWKTPIKYVVFCTVDFYAPIWYLIAMIEIYIFWLIIVKQKKEEALIKYIPIMFILQIILNTYRDTMELDWFLKNNFVTRGLSWFMLGYFFNLKKSDFIKKINAWVLALIVIWGLIIAEIPTLFDLKIKFESIGYIFMAVGLFAVSLKKPFKKTSTILEYIGEFLSLYVYVFHILISKILNFSLKKIGLNVETSVVYAWINPIIVMILSIFFSAVVIYIKKIMNKKKIMSCKNE